MPKDYIHPILGEEQQAIGGHYVLTREERIVVGGVEILCLFGAGVFDTSCCGTGGCAYALVPGAIVRYKYSRKEKGPLISEVEPVTDKAQKMEIRKAIEKIVPVGQVEFLS